MKLARALVISTGRNSAWVALDGEPTPRLAQLRRVAGARSMPVPGDWAMVRMLEDDGVVLERIEPRRTVLVRASARGRSKTLAANVDTLVTVTSLGDPPPRTVTLDQLLAFAERASVAAIVVLTKPDRAAAGVADQLAQTYGALGYPVIVCNPRAGENVAPLRAALIGRQALLGGVSGVGKSTIFAALGGRGSTGDVSRHGLGRQTTTAAHLYRSESGFLIDSPGVSDFGLGDLGPAELASGFREFAAPALGCRFADCTHLREPDCAVAAAVARGTIAGSRYASYRKLQRSSA